MFCKKNDIVTFDVVIFGIDEITHRALMSLQVGIPSLFIQAQVVLEVVDCKKAFLIYKKRMPLNIHYKIESELSTFTPITPPSSYFYEYGIEIKGRDSIIAYVCFWTPIDQHLNPQLLPCWNFDIGQSRITFPYVSIKLQEIHIITNDKNVEFKPQYLKLTYNEKYCNLYKK